MKVNLVKPCDVKLDITKPGLTKADLTQESKESAVKLGRINAGTVNKLKVGLSAYISGALQRLILAISCCLFVMVLGTFLLLAKAAQSQGIWIELTPDIMTNLVTYMIKCATVGSLICILPIKRGIIFIPLSLLGTLLVLINWHQPIANVLVF
ncbi:hypothetical protein [Zooshikella ganghwensis]|uniref:Uncharacterized protein n=1 Tax=Zooshikella ganghwensis TaxID=202772 RepID=A0A4P9VI20_9GAMM|nr:hypothetical protein [Zooshikella ganghwensis]RDH42089.1 hypothetical protein B9G39_00775 [Zooshikella ganghwensis]